MNLPELLRFLFLWQTQYSREQTKIIPTKEKAAASEITSLMLLLSCLCNSFSPCWKPDQPTKSISYSYRFKFIYPNKKPHKIQENLGTLQTSQTNSDSRREKQTNWI